MPSPSFFSQAGNFISTAQGGTDPRTGLFNVSLPLAALHAGNLAGPALDLSLQYSPLSSLNDGFGRGFSLRLTRYDTTTGTLALSTGEQYRVSSSGNTVRQKKLNNFIFKKTDDSSCLVVHKSGLTEHLSLHGTVYVPVRITAPDGHSLSLTWGGTYQPARLLKVEDDTGRVLCTVSYPDTAVATTMFRLLPDDAEYGYSIVFKFTRALLVRVTRNADATPQRWTFSYDDVGQGRNWRAITGIATPTGLKEEVAYYTDRGMAFPDIAGLAPLPCVATHRVYPGGGQPAVVTQWQWTQKNYLGRDAGLSQWQPDTDSMLNILLSDYQYGSTAKLMDADGRTVLSAVTRRYNSYHLQISESRLRAGKKYQQDTRYHAREGATFDKQPAQYALPVSQTEVWSSGRDTARRRRVSCWQFDEAGNLLHQVAPDGTITQYDYYPAQGGRDCPPDPHGFTRRLKKRAVIPCQVKGDEPATVVFYGWKKLNALSGEGYAVVADTVTETTGYIQTVVISDYYEDAGDKVSFGRVKTRTTILQPDVRIKINYIHTESFTYSVTAQGLSQSVTLTTHDRLTATRSTQRHPLLGHLLSETDTQGVTVKYTYDKTGRVRNRTLAPETAYEQKTGWSYSIDSTGPITIETDPVGNQIKMLFDGAGRAIKRMRYDNDYSKRWFEVSSQYYNVLGELVKDSGSDWLISSSGQSEQYRVTTTTSFDGWGNISEQATFDGVRTLQMVDPVALTTSIYTRRDEEEGELSTGRVLLELDERSLLPSIERRSYINKQTLSVRLYQWDGLGRLRQATDELGHKTEWKYDDLGRVLSQSLPDGTVIEKTYAPHLTEKKVASICVKTKSDVNGKEMVWQLGSQEFDGLGRIVRQVVCGKVTSYTYDGPSPGPSKVSTSSGNRREFEYIPELRNVVSKITAGSVKQIFKYHSATGVIVSAEENGIKIQKTLYPSGRLKKETCTQANSVFDASYDYTLEGSINQATDIDKKRTIYGKDSFGRITNITDDALTVSLKYDLLGRLDRQVATDIKTKAVLNTALTYDDFNREIIRKISDSSRNNITISQTWLKNDLLETRLTQQDGQLLRMETFVYDTRNRLTTYTVYGNSLPTDAYGHQMTAQKFHYDALNNLTSVTTTLEFGSGNVDVATYHYENTDNPMQLTSVTHTLSGLYPKKIALEYDAHGCMTKDESGRTRYYDEFDRLVRIGNDGSYGYDALNRLVCQTVSNTDTRQFYYRANKLVNVVLTQQQKQTITRLIRDEHTCLGVGNGDDMTLTAGDHHNTLQWSYDTSQRAGTEHVWSPYGGGKPSGMFPAFNGEWADPVTGNYLLGNGFRAYSPALMRFTCPDNLSPFGAGGINPYAYCAGDPVNLTDPSGHISSVALVGIVAGIVGIGLALMTGGMSLMAAGCIIGAVVNTASSTILVAGALGLAADVTGIASAAVENRNPEASNILGWISLATGLASVVAGIDRVLITSGELLLQREQRGAALLELQVLRSHAEAEPEGMAGVGINHLPGEMIRNIGRYLPLEDLKSFRAASSKFAEAVPIRDVIARTSPVHRFSTVLDRYETETMRLYQLAEPYSGRIARLDNYLRLHGIDDAARLEAFNIHASLQRKLAFVRGHSNILRDMRVARNVFRHYYHMVSLYDIGL